MIQLCRILSYKSLLVTLSMIASGILSIATAQAAPVPPVDELPGWVERADQWNDFDRWHFKVDGRSAYVVRPDQSLPGNPWVWRARFPGYHAEMDQILISKGFHLVYLDVAGLFGAPVAIEAADACYDKMRRELNLAPKMALEGVSRGGLFVYQFALRFPERVACIYADTPVCDFKSWPGGWGNSKGSPTDWKRCLEAYELSEEEALAFKGNPIDQAEAIARSGIPLLHIVSLNDAVVPVDENTSLLRERVAEWGGTLNTIEVAQGTPASNGHHFDHPAVENVVRFIARHAAPHLRIESKQTSPNIVLFLVDDMGWQDTSVPFHHEETEFNRRYRTPNMERLAQEGTRFSQAYACSVCSPTRISLMTGQNAVRHRVTNWTLRKNATNDRSHATLEFPNWNVNGLSQEKGVERTVTTRTLAQRLQEHGYQTIHVGKAHFGAIDTPGADPENLGFSVNIAGHAAGGPGSYLGTQNFSAAWRNGDRVWDVPGLDHYHGQDVFLTEALTNEAIEQVDLAVEQEKPFFLYMSHYAVHVPLAQDPRFIQPYVDASLDPKEAMYAAMVEGMDDSLGVILDRLDHHGIADNTIVIFVSDNGGLSASGRGGPKHQHNRPLSSGKGSAHEGGVRVPQIVRWPGVADENAWCRQPVAIEDLYPTILAAAGVTWESNDLEQLDGKSWISFLGAGDSTEDRRRLVWHFPNHWGPNGPGIGPSSSLRRGPWKLIYYHADRTFELFNLEQDLGESQDLSEDRRDLVISLAKELGEHLRGVNAQMPTDKTTGRLVPWPDEAAEKVNADQSR